MKTALVFLLPALILVQPLPAPGEQPAAALAARCAGCHGPRGISRNPLWPNLAGQKTAYLIRQLEAFRDGERQDPLMSPQAAPLTDAQIETLALYYNRLGCVGEE